jgi:hypothetical protein
MSVCDVRSALPVLRCRSGIVLMNERRDRLEGISLSILALYLWLYRYDPR